MTQAIDIIPEADLTALLNKFKAQLLVELNCHQWGIIQSFDATKQTAVVQVAVLRQVVDATATPPVFVNKPYPILLDVPVFANRGGTGFLTFPITAGDLCLVLFNDRDYDSFWATGNVQEPNSPRLHSLSDGLALVGFSTKAKKLANWSTSQAVLALGTTKVTLGSKVGITNATISLLTVLTNLITTLKAFTDTNGDGASPATIALLTQNQTDITNLLQ